MSHADIMNPKISHRLGWIRDTPDARDVMYAAPSEVLAKLPAAADLRSTCPPVYDQGHLGSCTGNAIAGAIQFERIKQGLDKSFVPSRLFIYYNERVMENTVDSDAGAQIRDGIKSVAKQGACSESDWPYNIKAFREKPSDQAYKDALGDRAVTYQRIIQNLMQLKGCVASGFPFVFGFTVYDSFYSEEVSKTGIVPMPNLATETVQGGHAVLAVGYDDASQRFIVRNSWGPDWGMKGYFTIPYLYLADHSLSSDMWSIRVVSSDAQVASRDYGSSRRSHAA